MLLSMTSTSLITTATSLTHIPGAHIHWQMYRMMLVMLLSILTHFPGARTWTDVPAAAGDAAVVDGHRQPQLHDHRAAQSASASPRLS